MLIATKEVLSKKNAMVRGSTLNRQWSAMIYCSCIKILDPQNPGWVTEFLPKNHNEVIRFFYFITQLLISNTVCWHFITSCNMVAKRCGSVRSMYANRCEFISYLSVEIVLINIYVYIYICMYSYAYCWIGQLHITSTISLGWVER